MKSPAPYLVVSELDCTGYIIGYFETIPQAEKVLEELMNKYQHANKGQGEQLFEKAMNYPTYKIHPTSNYSIQNKYCCHTNGEYSRYIICTDYEGFSLNQFILDRGSTIYLFDIQQYDIDSGGFVKGFLNLIAN